MFKFFIMYLMTMNSIIMYFINNPLSMGLFILIQTMLMALITGMMINTYWFSYILFLTFLGGLMVLFIYVCSIASNELMKFSSSLLISSFIFFIMFTMIFYNKSLFVYNLDMINFNDYFLLIDNNSNKINLNKLYNSNNYMLMFMLIIYLFITLIAVIKINNIYSGPLRSNFN